MTLFLWVMISLFALNAGGKLIWLATRKFPERNSKTEAIDVVVNVAFIVWAVVLLVTA